MRFFFFFFKDRFLPELAKEYTALAEHSLGHKQPWQWGDVAAEPGTARFVLLPCSGSPTNSAEHTESTRHAEKRRREVALRSCRWETGDCLGCQAGLGCQRSQAGLGCLYEDKEATATLCL